MAYEKTEIKIYVTSKLFPGMGNVYAANKYIAVDGTGRVLSNGANIREVAAKHGVRLMAVAKDENGIAHRTTGVIVR